MAYRRGRALGEALQADRLQVAWHPRLEPRRRYRLVKNDLPERLHRARPPERRPAGEHLVEDRPEGVDVGRRADLGRLPQRLLARHVAGRSHHLPAERLALALLALQPLGQAEVGDLGYPGRVEQHVRRLQVAMNDPHPVDRRHGARQRHGQLRRGPRRHRRAIQPLGQRPPFEQFEREIGQSARLAHLVDLHDMGMPQPRHRLGLDPEPPELRWVDVPVGPDHLEGNRALQRLLSRLVNHAHSPLTEPLSDHIAGEGGGGRKVHVHPGVRRSDIGRRRVTRRFGCGGVAPNQDRVKQADGTEPLRDTPHQQTPAPAAASFTLHRARTPRHRGNNASRHSQ